MHNIVEIDPVTRIEGHARITIHLDDDGSVADARFHVTEFRGFEQLCIGRPFTEMPALTARTCGICPISHLLAASRAGDAIMGVTPPPAARALRSLANLGQVMQSHALSVFHLSAPDLLLGMDAEPETRNVFALMESHPDLVRAGIRLRQFGQEVIAAVSGQRIHGPKIVAGGVADPLTPAQVASLQAMVGEAIDGARMSLALYVDEIVEGFGPEIAAFGNLPSLFLGHCTPDGTWSHDDGGLRVTDAQGRIVADQIDPADYRTFFGEAGTDDSYLKSPYWRPTVEQTGVVADGMYRVGPLARLNLCERMGTPLADEALAVFREVAGAPATSSFHFHHARLIEILACTERIAAMLDDPLLTDPNVRVTAGVTARHGVGASEAPRGTLFHAYDVDEGGLVTGVDMLIATGQNNLAMNAAVKQVAQTFVTDRVIPQGTLNRLEASVRAFDPCLSCSTHAIGQMPLLVRLQDAQGEVLQELRRD